MTPTRTLLEALGSLITYAWDKFNQNRIALPDGYCPDTGLAVQNVEEPDFGNAYRWDVLGFANSTSPVSFDRLPLETRDSTEITCGQTEDGLGMVIFHRLGVALQFKTAEGSRVRA